MPRTGLQRARRARLADAAAGVHPSRNGVDRATVVLLVRDAPRAGDATVEVLRRHAEARDWRVVAEVSSWAEVRKLIETAQADGVVTNACAAVPAPHREWLTDALAFVVSVECDTATADGSPAEADRDH
ncbi:hypothetical protein [Streptomyces sp. NPDC058953]|uniref:hypothetical protein n=1 Tax=unclassified Streptomyces TaxID=2593676 RepID=UPI0036AB44E9